MVFGFAPDSGIDGWTVQPIHLVDLVAALTRFRRFLTLSIGYADIQYSSTFCKTGVEALYS